MNAVHNSKLSAIVLAAAGVFFIGSHAIAQAPSQIFACVNNSSGTIKIVAAGTICDNGGTLFSWNTQGPIGPQGPQGPAGAAGATGAQGPSNAFFVKNDNTQNITGNTQINIMTLSLAPGSYVLNVSAAFGANATGGMAFSVYCYITASNAEILTQPFQETFAPSANSFLLFPLTTAFTLAASDKVSLACSGLGGIINTNQARWWPSR